MAKQPLGGQPSMTRAIAKDLLRMAGLSPEQIASIAVRLSARQMIVLGQATREHFHRGKHWLQAHHDRLTPSICDVAANIDYVLFYLKCARCGETAVFTAEGPNDEYPEPLCEKCEAGDE